MRRALVLADGAEAAANGEDQVLTLRTSGGQRNLRVGIDVVGTSFQRNLPGRLHDLLRIASYVYGADTRVKRGTEKDVFGDEWIRHLRMVVPVHDLRFWQSDATLERLVSALEFLTGDVFKFEFVARTGPMPGERIPGL